jgi:hypothetical protein
VVLRDGGGVSGRARDHFPCCAQHLRVVWPLEKPAMTDLFITISDKEKKRKVSKILVSHVTLCAAKIVHISTLNAHKTRNTQAYPKQTKTKNKKKKNKKKKKTYCEYKRCVLAGG